MRDNASSRVCQRRLHPAGYLVKAFGVRRVMQFGSLLILAGLLLSAQVRPHLPQTCNLAWYRKAAWAAALTYRSTSLIRNSLVFYFVGSLLILAGLLFSAQVRSLSPEERRENELRYFKDFYVKSMARIWP